MQTGELAQELAERQAWGDSLHQGSVVHYRGVNRRVNAIKARGIDAPLFQLEGVSDGWTSYLLCGPAREG